MPAADVGRGRGASGGACSYCNRELAPAEECLVLPPSPSLSRSPGPTDPESRSIVMASGSPEGEATPTWCRRRAQSAGKLTSTPQQTVRQTRQMECADKLGNGRGRMGL